jgi:hypothetical protein
VSSWPSITAQQAKMDGADEAAKEDSKLEQLSLAPR